MKKLFILTLLGLTVLGLFSGCSSGVERIGLQVQLVKLDKKANGSLLASLLLSNPNVSSVNVAKSTHQLTLNGRSAGILEVTEPVGIPAQQTTTITVSFTPVSGTADVSGPVSYQLASQLTLRIYDDDTERYKTSSSGTVTVQ